MTGGEGQKGKGGVKIIFETYQILKIKERFKKTEWTTFKIYVSLR